MTRFARFLGVALSAVLIFPAGFSPAAAAVTSVRPGYTDVGLTPHTQHSLPENPRTAHEMRRTGFVRAQKSGSGSAAAEKKTANRAALSSLQERRLAEISRTGGFFSGILRAWRGFSSSLRTPGGYFVLSDGVLSGLTPEGELHFKTVHELTVPDGVRKIGKNVFKSRGLRKISLPQSVKEIDDYAFYDNKISEVSLSHVSKIGRSAFQKNAVAGKLELKNLQLLGESAFTDNAITEVEIKEDRPLTDTSARLETIAKNTFRDNEISSVTLPQTVRVLSEACFANNRLKNFPFREGMTSVGDGAFSGNFFSEVALPQTITQFGNDVFANNKRWIKITSAPAAVKDAKYASGFGHVRTAVSINLRFVNETGMDIVSPQVLKSEFFEPDGVHYLGVENTMDVPDFSGYVLDTVNGVPFSGDKVRFTPDRDGYALVLKYKRKNLSPVIEGKINKNFAVGSTVDAAALLAGVTARDAAGNPLTVSVSFGNIDSRIQNQAYDVYYRATDAKGHTVTVPGKVLIGTDWREMPICAGWKVKDFLYVKDGEPDAGQIAGLNPEGAHGTDREIKCWPSVNGKGESVYKIADKAFEGRSLKKIPQSWGSLTELGSRALFGNEIEALPESWGKIGKLGEAVFSWNSTLKSIPPNWGDLREIPGYTFAGSGITKLPGDWGEITRIGNDAFYQPEDTKSRGISALPASWGKITEIGKEAFTRNRLTALPVSWGEITSLGEDSFGECELPAVPSSWGKITKIGGYAFARNRLTALPASWGKLTELPWAVFRLNPIASVPASWDKIAKIGGAAFEGNKLTSLPSDWGDVSEIGSDAFKNNMIASLPSDWGRITKLGGDSFSYNKIGALPSSWKNITAIGNDAFRANRIAAIPGHWGKITYISYGAFFANRIKSIPKHWENVRWIGKEAFSKNEIAAIPDTWEKVEGLGDYAFDTNKLTEIPAHWGSLTEIGDNAFSRNPLKKLPQSWENITKIGNNAFSQTQIAAVPDTWGKITKIGAEAFSETNLKMIPPSWDGVTDIGYGAFASTAVTAVPESWGEITHLGSRAFSGCRLSKIPSSWGKISGPLEYSVFAGSNLTKIPDDWGEITGIDEGAFAGSHISALPASWGKITYVGDRAFADNNIAKLPDSWGEITKIGRSSFEDNKIAALPDSWGKIDTLDQYSFRGNEIAKIPDDWGEITVLPLAVLSDNKITHLPASWGKIKEIVAYSLEGNPFKNIPDSWGGVQRIGNEAFEHTHVEKIPLSWGKVSFHPETFGFTYPEKGKYKTGAGEETQKMDLVFEEDDEDVQRVMDTLGSDSSGALALPGRIAYIRPKSGVRPAGIKDTKFVKILDGTFGGTVKVRHLDEDGRELHAPETIVYDLRKQVRTNEENGKDPNSKTVDVKPLNLLGYKSPAARVALMDGSVKEITFRYSRINPGEIQKGKLNLNGTITNTLIGHELETEVTFDSEEPLEDGSILVHFDPGYVSYIRNSGSEFIGHIGEETPGVLKIRLKPIKTGTKIIFYLRWKLKERITPAKKKFPVYAVLLDGKNTLRKTKTVNLSGYYNLPELKKRVRKDLYDYVSDFDADSTGKSVAQSGKNYAVYEFSLDSLYRNADKYTITDELPEYEKSDGTKARAVFVAEENPGWTQGPDNKLTYTAAERLLTVYNSLAVLKLHFPGAKIESDIKNGAKAQIIPENKGEQEGTMLSAGSDFFRFYKPVAPEGKQSLEKQALGPHYYSPIGSYVIYDTDNDKKSVIPWKISVSAGKKKIPSPTFTDYDLDPRLRYSAIVPSRYMVGANVLLTDAAGKIRYKTSVNGFDRVLLPQEITALPGIRLTVSDMLTFNKGDITEFTVETKLKDPAQPLYAKGSSAGNTLRNYSVLKSSDGESLSSGASVKIRPAGRVFTALKTIDDAKAILTGNERVYSVGSEVENDYSDPSVNFELTDLIPKGVDVKDIRLTEAFARLPGAGYELIPNYRNTGRTAVRFTADEVETEEPLRHIADIAVYFSVMVDDSNKTVENDAYVRATGKHTAYRNEVENPPAGPGKWSKAAVVSSISTTKEVYIEKKVRQKGRQEWKDKIQTAPGARIEYSLRVVNGTVLQIESPVIYDVLPYKGDKTLFTGERNSQFSNRLGDTPITLPQGWNVRYTCDPNVNNNNLTSVSWQSERCADVTALRFAGDVIPPRTDVRVILPMTAGPKGSAPGSREHLYQSAVNHFIYNDKNRKNAAGYGNAIESNRASNELIPPLSHITFKKLGMNIVKGHGVVSRDPLAGALFGLYDGGGKLRQKAVSNKDGEVSFTAPAERGWFVRELRAPAGFGLSEIIYTLGEKDFTDLDEKNGVYNVRIKDVVDFPKFIPVIPGIGSVEFTKVDVEGKPLGNVEFTLTPTSTRNLEGYDGPTPKISVQTVSSDEKGFVKFYNVPVGTYVLRETKAPLEHLQQIEGMKVIVRKNGERVILGENGRLYNNRYWQRLYKIGIRGSVTQKPFGSWQANDGERLSARFNLYEDGQYLREVSVGPWDGAWLGDLKPGSVYALEETQAPQTHILQPQRYKFTVNAKGEACDEQGKPFLIQDGLFVPNEEKAHPSELTVTKKDPDDPDAKPDGAGFALFRKEGDTYVRVAVAETKDGTAKFSDIPEGTYQAREIKAPLGYGRSSRVYDFSVGRYDSQKFTWTVENYRAKIKILKYEPAYKGVTKDFAAKAVADNADYKMWENNVGLYDVGVPLPKAVFEVTDAAGAVQEELTTDESGNAVLGRRLDSDTQYFLREVKPPAGYIRKQSPVPFRINDYAALESFSGNIDLTVPNTKDGAMVTVSKMAKESGKSLPGARFKLTGPRGKNPHGYGKELVTDENGILSFDGLEYGKKYILRETAAPKGYALDPTEHTVIVKDDSNPVFNVRVYNELSPADVRLEKVDGDGRPLSGVRFGLCDLLGKCVVLPDSDSAGLIGFSVVRGREYVLRELDTVAGYALLPQPVRFGVDGDGAVSVADGGVDSVSVGRSGGYSVLRVVNYRQGRVPLSGGFGFYWFVLPGCLVLAAGVFVLFKFKREGELG